MYRSLYLQVKTAVTGSDLVVVALGTGQDVEAEGRDRPDITLPGQQLQLLQDAVSMGTLFPWVRPSTPYSHRY